MIIGGIYKIVNKITGQYYIGSSANLTRRKNDHFRLLRTNIHPNIYLQRAFNKYGLTNFEFILIKVVKDKNELIKEEQIALDSVDRGVCYNLSFVAGKVEMTPEIRKKLSQANIGAKHTQETKQKISKALSGRKSNNPFKKGRLNPNWEKDMSGETNPSADRDKYVFFNIETLFFFVGSRHDFSREAKIDIKLIGELVRGSLKTLNKKWVYVSSPTQTYIRYLITDPQGKVFFTSHISQFCRLHNLNRSSINDLIKKRSSSLFGWRIKSEIVSMPESIRLILLNI